MVLEGLRHYDLITGTACSQKHQLIALAGKALRDRQDIALEQIVDWAHQGGNPISEQWARTVFSRHMNCIGVDNQGSVKDKGIPGNEIGIVTSGDVTEEILPEICRSGNWCPTLIHNRRGECPILLGDSQLELQVLPDGTRTINGIPHKRYICDIGGGPLIEAFNRGSNPDNAVVVLDPDVDKWIQVYSQSDFRQGLEVCDELIGRDEATLDEMELLYALMIGYGNHGNVYPVATEFQDQRHIPSGFFDLAVCSFPFPDLEGTSPSGLSDFVAKIVTPGGRFLLRTEAYSLFDKMRNILREDDRFTSPMWLPDELDLPLTLWNMKLNIKSKNPQYALSVYRRNIQV